MSTKAKIRSFFGPQRQYAVAGASNNPSKFGFKITNWYVGHDISVIPINPKEQEILGQTVIHNVSTILDHIEKGQDLSGYKLSNVDGLSISFLTPPSITATTLKEIASHDNYQKLIKGLWFQPGSYDATVLETADKIGLFEKVVQEDECILVRGEEGLYSSNL
ncbi:CoA-binding protein [Scheffersomyces amazonensis]|uniref:CoA-binding protein n=1 Tax=Scheffersomyces amazonensis TaxID=1078765 RepID=UPI00315CE9F0